MSADQRPRRSSGLWRPATAPAYYLGRPASVWIAAARRRSDPDGASQQVSAHPRRSPA